MMPRVACCASGSSTVWRCSWGSAQRAHPGQSGSGCTSWCNLKGIIGKSVWLLVSQDAFLRGPVEGTDAPQVDEAYQQQGDEDGGFNKADPAAFPNGDGPGEEIERLDVEDDEEHGDQIELGGETQTGIADGFYAGFEGPVFGAAIGSSPSKAATPIMVRQMQMAPMT